MYRAQVLDVLRIEGGQIAEITSFEPHLFPAFGLADEFLSAPAFTGMRKLVVNTFLSLDGVMQAPGGPDEDPTEGFDAGGWAVGYWDDVMGAAMAETMDASRSTCCSAARPTRSSPPTGRVSDEPGAEPEQGPQVRRLDDSR